MSSGYTSGNDESEITQHSPSAAGLHTGSTTKAKMMPKSTADINFVFLLVFMLNNTIHIASICFSLQTN